MKPLPESRGPLAGNRSGTQRGPDSLAILGSRRAMCVRPERQTKARLTRCVMAVACAMATLISVTEAAAAEGRPTLTVADSDAYQLRNVNAWIDASDVIVSGWVGRAPGNHSISREHIHITAFDSAGSAISSLDETWPGQLRSGPRRRHSAHFRVTFQDGQPTSIASVSVSIEPGARCNVGEADRR